MNLSPKNSDPLIQNVVNVSEIGINGIAIAVLIISLWAISLGFLLTTVNVKALSLGWKAGAMLCQTFLYTGIFITAHDAMHGSILPKHPQLNTLIGSFCLMVYGLFSYKKLLKAHCQHHLHPANDLDPDFHDGKSTGAIAWYLYFMKRYWSWWRLLGLIMVYHVMHRLFHIPEANLVSFWIVPSLLSSVQLFYFGTFLPHRQPKEGYADDFRTQSVYRPLWWSFLTCYHFGYHHEHHQYPNLAWWQLPDVAKISMFNSVNPTP
jgi:beta-carotene ketolase (CrtW type)